jgi:PP-loop superfamily ATP-utilizing enzyme
MTNAPANEHSGDLAVRELGVRCVVEPRGNLAVVIPAPDERGLEAPDVRQRVLAALRACGFTHVAVDLSHVGEPIAWSGDPNA